MTRSTRDGAECLGLEAAPCRPLGQAAEDDDQKSQAVAWV